MSTSSISDRIIGLWLKRAKPGWTLDGERIEEGAQGFRFTVIPTTAVWGQRQWVDHRVVGRALHLYSDGFPLDWEEIPLGWDGYTGFQGMFGPNGELLTYTGGLGARNTVGNVVTQYQFLGRNRFPVCTLGSRPRGDQYDNVDPVFRIVEWVSVNDFADRLPRELLEAPPRLAPPTAPTTEEPPTDDAPPIDEDDDNLARVIDDNIPF